MYDYALVNAERESAELRAKLAEAETSLEWVDDALAAPTEGGWKWVFVVESGDYEQRGVRYVANSLDTAVQAIKEPYGQPYIVTWDAPRQTSFDWELVGHFSRVEGHCATGAIEWTITRYEVLSSAPQQASGDAPSNQCPMDGIDVPHAHSPRAVLAWLKIQARRFLNPGEEDTIEIIQRQGAPDGWKLMPVVVTKEMVNAVLEIPLMPSYSIEKRIQIHYDAMLRTAPTPQLTAAPANASGKLRDGE